MLMKYRYQAVNSQGKPVRGSLNAAGEREAARQLRRQNLTVLALEEEGSGARRSGNKPPRPGELVLVLHQLTTLLESGVTLNEAVNSLAQALQQPFLHQAFADLSARLRGGTGFAAALRQSRLALPEYFYQLAEAGELTGKLTEALRGGIAQWRYQLEVANELRNALIYPSILIVSGIAAVLLMFVLVVPKFAVLLGKSQAPIPLLSQLILGIGMAFNRHLPELGAGMLALIMLGGLVLRQSAWRQRLLDWAGRLPLFGVWLGQEELGRWAALLGALLQNRVELLRALELSGRGLRLSALRAGLQQVGSAVRQGVSLSQALEEHVALDATGHNLVRVGERSGELPRMLQSLAALYGDSVRQRLKRFLLLLEPLAILFIGGVIGLIMIGIVLAITAVNDIRI